MSALTQKANTGGGSRAGGLLQRLQRRVALEALGESGASLGAEAVVAQTASMGAEVGAEVCQGALTLSGAAVGCGGALEVGDLCLLEDSSKRGGALGSDVVAFETVSEGCMGWEW